MRRIWCVCGNGCRYRGAADVCFHGPGVCWVAGFVRPLPAFKSSPCPWLGLRRKRQQWLPRPWEPPAKASGPVGGLAPVCQQLVFGGRVWRVVFSSGAAAPTVTLQVIRQAHWAFRPVPLYHRWAPSFRNCIPKWNGADLGCKGLECTTYARVAFLCLLSATVARGACGRDARADAPHLLPSGARDRGPQA